MTHAEHFRAHHRRTWTLDASLRPGHGPEAELEVTVLDVGLGGAGLSLARPLEPGCSFTLTLSLPTRWAPLELQASSRWCHPEGPGWRAGLAFELRDELELASLMEFLALEPS